MDYTPNEKRIRTIRGVAYIASLVGVFILIAALALCEMSCGFATDQIGDTEYIEVDGPTKYKKLVVGYCDFRIDIKVDIPDYWKENPHQFAVKSAKMERSRYSTWDNLFTHLSCGFCRKGITGMISVLDSKFNLVPWGCGPERPPLNIIEVTSTFVSPTGATPVELEGTAGWEDEPLKVYTRTFIPELMPHPDFCDGDLVTFNLDEACEALVDAGVMEKIKQ